jgi:hypothetical protein
VAHNIGEVFRRNHGAEWGTISDGPSSFPGMRWKGGKETFFWPWGRVHKHTLKGDENNVWHYYQRVLGDLKAGSAR